MRSGCWEDKARTIMDLGIKCTEEYPNKRGDHESISNTLKSLRTVGQSGEKKKQKK